MPVTPSTDQINGAQVEDAATPSRQTEGGVSNRYAWYATLVMMVAYTFSFLDRQILNLMIGPIEADLHITDSEFAIIAGGAFGIFYTIMGLPIGWLADRYNRKWIVAIGIALWSLMTASCGLARSFSHLFTARIGVGVGEATLSPSAYSLLSDYFDKAHLPRAMSVYTFGIFIGAGLALIVGGQVIGLVEHRPDMVLPLLGAMHPWQLVFIIVGLPGVVLSVWLATLREPKRRGRTDILAGERRKKDFAFQEVFRFMARYPWMSVSMFLGSAFFSVLGYADTWYPELYIRTWGWSASLSGAVNGLTSLIAGPLGLMFAGWYSSRMIKQGRVDACLRLTAFGAVGIALPAILMPLMPTPLSMALWLIPLKFCVGFPPVLIPAAIQMAAPNQIRAQLGAVFLFTVGIIGVTCGPILPALLTDYVFHDDNALRYSLSISTGIMGPIAFGVLWLGLREYRQCYADTAQDIAHAAQAASPATP